MLLSRHAITPAPLWPLLQEPLPQGRGTEEEGQGERVGEGEWEEVESDTFVAYVSAGQAAWHLEGMA